MKFFVLLIVAATLLGVNSSTSPENPTDILKSYQDACIEETGVDDEKINNIRNGDFSDKDDELNNFVFCFYKMYLVVTDEGTLKNDYILSIIPDYLDKEKTSEVLEACMGEKGANPQETAFFAAKCVDEKYKDLSIFQHL